MYGFDILCGISNVPFEIPLSMNDSKRLGIPMY